MPHRAVWKFPISIHSVENVVTLQVPRGGVIRSVGVQHRDICLWVEVDPKTAARNRLVRIAGTGHAVPVGPSGVIGEFIGTVMLYQGDLVLHLYDLGEQAT